MKPLKKILLINLLILLAYTALSGLLSTSGRDHNGLGTMILIALAVGLHSLVLMILSVVKFVRNDRAAGKAYILAALLVMLIGYSACYGIGTLLSR